MFTDSAKIESYARQNLNMKKQSHNQINYIMGAVPKKTKKKVYKNNYENNLMSYISDFIKNMFY